MTQITVPFIGSRHVDRSLQVNGQRCVNWYPTLEGDGAESVLTLNPTPGYTQRVTGGNGPCRSNLVTFGGNLYWVSGAQVMKMTSAEVVTAVGSLTTTAGRCYLAAGRTKLMIVDGTFGYSCDGTALTKVTHINFPANPVDCNYLNGFFLVCSSGSDQWRISSSEDPLTWPGLYFLTADAKSDDAKRIITTTRDIYVVGDESTQVYYPVDNPDIPFALYTNGVLEFGCAAPASVARVGANIFMLAQRENGDSTVLMVSGFTAQPIGDSDLAYTFEQMSTVADAEGYAYVDNDQTFYVLTFPTADLTLVYHVEQAMWHDRQSSGMGRHRSSGHGRFAGHHYVGDSLDGRLGIMDQNVFTEYGATIRRSRVMSTQHRERRQFEVNAFELEMQAGIGLQTGQGSDPQAMLRYSRDGGMTWSAEIWRPIGKVGEYENRCVWTRFGQMNRFTAELVVTDPVLAVVISAYADINVLSP